LDAALSIGDPTRMKEMVRLLIDAGAKANYVLAQNATYPWYNALYRVCGDEETFEMILAAGGKPSIAIGAYEYVIAMSACMVMDMQQKRRM
jgi:hypothetical protein